MTYAKPVNYPAMMNWGNYPSGGVHRAIDYLAPMGSRVQSAMNGVVTTAGWSATGFGWHVRVLFDDGYTGIYGHLSKMSVSVGQRVAKRQQIGLSGSTGNSTGPHLHFEVRSSSWNPLTSVNYTSKLEPYAAPVAPPAGASSSGAPVGGSFNRSLLKYGANNAEVKRFQQWFWSKQGGGYKAEFKKKVYDFDAKGFTTNYGPATAKMVQDAYTYLNKTYPKGGWNVGWVNGVPPKEPGPGFFVHYGASSY